MSEVVLSALAEDPLSLKQVMDAVSSPGCGAVATFTGTIRNHDRARPVERLVYEAHPSAAALLAESAQRVADAIADVRIAVIHRVGALDIGEAAVVAAVAAPHRAEAFRAIEQLIDDLKATVPIWKHQQFADGTHEWVNSP